MDGGDAHGNGTGRRFDFGENWRAFSDALATPERLDRARASLAALVGAERIAGRSFLDVGCGSGLFSLAAADLGAARVHGFDVSENSVRASRDNLARLRPERERDGTVTFTQGSVLDPGFTAALDPADTVYAWGSLHHTGAMWQAVDEAARLTAPGGTLVLALYNRHWTSPLWLRVKRLYNTLPPAGRRAMVAALSVPVFLGVWATTRRWPLSRDRGMDFHYDLVDWIGGYPYEYASPDETAAHMARLGFAQRAVVPQEGWTGCVQYVFTRPR